jgi:hypothetical protein
MMAFQKACQRAIWMGMVTWTDKNGDKVWEWPEHINTPGSTGSELEWTGAGTPSFGNFTVPKVGGGSQVVNIDYSTFLADGTWWGVADDPNKEQLKLAYWNGYQVINTQSDSSQKVQDQMIAYGGSAGIPEPASFAVWSVLAGAVAGIGAIRRRKRHAQ